MAYETIPNPSRTATMRATLRLPFGQVKVFEVPPRDVGIPVAGPIDWPLWTLEWIEPRKGLMRFGRPPTN